MPSHHTLHNSPHSTTHHTLHNSPHSPQHTTLSTTHHTLHNTPLFPQHSTLFTTHHSLHSTPHSPQHTTLSTTHHTLHNTPLSPRGGGSTLALVMQNIVETFATSVLDLKMDWNCAMDYGIKEKTTFLHIWIPECLKTLLSSYLLANLLIALY